jgi:hypothetical protein
LLTDICCTVQSTFKRIKDHNDRRVMNQMSILEGRPLPCHRNADGITFVEASRGEKGRLPKAKGRTDRNTAKIQLGRRAAVAASNGRRLADRKQSVAGRTPENEPRPLCQPLKCTFPALDVLQTASVGRRPCALVLDIDPATVASMLRQTSDLLDELPWDESTDRPDAASDGRTAAAATADSFHRSRGMSHRMPGLRG